jgi:hypothetical protein
MINSGSLSVEDALEMMKQKLGNLIYCLCKKNWSSNRLDMKCCPSYIKIQLESKENIQNTLGLIIKTSLMNYCTRITG